MAAVSGIQAARLAHAGLASNDGTAASTLGGLIGTIDPSALTEQLGQRFDVSQGYLKIHASCSYTHPPIDAALAVRSTPGFDVDRIAAVEVRTHRLAVPLDRTEPATRLAAMFSIPHLVAVALRTGHVGVEASSEAVRQDPMVLDLAAKVRLVNDPDHDARAPAERPALVRVTLDDGRTISHEVPNPVGDAAHHPLDRAAVRAKLTTLIGDVATRTIEEVIEGLHRDPTRPARELLDALP